MVPFPELADLVEVIPRSMVNMSPLAGAPEIFIVHPLKLISPPEV